MGDEEEITEVCWLTSREALERRGTGEMTLPRRPCSCALPGYVPLRTRWNASSIPRLFRHDHRLHRAAPGIHIVPVKAHTLPPATHTNCAIVGETDLVIIDPGVLDEAEQKRFAVHLTISAKAWAAAPWPCC